MIDGRWGAADDYRRGALLPGCPVRLAMTIANSSGSTGLGTCIEKPDASALIRLLGRSSAVSAIAGILPPASGGNLRSRSIGIYPSWPVLLLFEHNTTVLAAASLLRNLSNASAAQDATLTRARYCLRSVATNSRALASSSTIIAQTPSSGKMG